MPAFCPICRSANVDEVLDAPDRIKCRDCHAYIPASEPTPEDAPTARISLATATADIARALGIHRAYADLDSLEGVDDEIHRVTTFLAQVEADQRQLVAALDACRVLSAHDPDAKLQATRLARRALGLPVL
ncbi:hypothetical protein V5E97_06870 [Singulisphaera sp. Ch08]|uniref:TFIIB-type zinc ribbon-containing protein n=1 Tax=Singulisphaera sp. Ch08 TaxID=3120278 RepID=A0AAU7CKQ5_9BACT